MQIEIIGDRIRARFSDLTPVIFFNRLEARSAAEGLLKAIQELENPPGLGINVSETIRGKEHLG